MKIIVTSLKRAERILISKSKRADITHIVSIGAPERAQQQPTGFLEHPARKLRLIFHDVTWDRDGVIVPTREHIEKLLDFYRGALAKNDDKKFLIHCYAGISRSTAAALILLYMNCGDEVVAAKELLQMVPSAAPNPKIIEYADELLGCDGKLKIACEEVRNTHG